MKGPLAIALGVFALAGCTTWPDLESPAPAEEIRRFYVEQVGDPECSVAIVSGGRTSFAGDPHAIYRIASLTKLFVTEALETAPLTRTQ